MADVNLEEYFRGKTADRGCPECPHLSTTDIEYRDHLWTHRKTDTGAPISKKNRRGKCPHPACQDKTFQSFGLTHIKIHTGAKEHVCPHLTSWEPKHRQLCGHKTSDKVRLSRHRISRHGYDKKLKTSRDPWVEGINGGLSDAKLYFSENGVKEEDCKPEEGQSGGLPTDNVPGNAPVDEPQAPPAVPPPNNINAPPPPGAHHHGIPFAGVNHGPHGPFVGAAHAHGHPQPVPGGPLLLRRVEVTRISQIPHPLGHIVTEIERRIYA